MPPDTERRLRLALTAFLAVYGVVLALHPERYGWLDSLDVAIHEVGHPLFGVFGEFIGMLGGTLMQLLIPALFVWDFRRRGDRHAATVALWWVAQNLWNISVYIKDARAEELPLDRKSTRLNSSHLVISYAVFCLKKKTISKRQPIAEHAHATH